MPDGSHQLRQLPSVDQLLSSPQGVELTIEYGHSMTVSTIRSVIEETRMKILAGHDIAPGVGALMDRVDEALRQLSEPSINPVVNATGVIVHTNLGRAPMSSKTLRSILNVGAVYSNLEFDLTTGKRGSRGIHATQLLIELTAAEDALVVNNNAAAVLLMLTGLCQGREVIISRGQLIEIGGGFRIPDVMAQSGARLIEVGTTNRTHLSDYERAIGDNTGAIMAAHHSNFKVVGFASEPTLEELTPLAREHGLPLLYDQGSGALIDAAIYGLDSEPTIQEALAAGVDLVCFSGDKLLGGPQAGILCGKRSIIESLRKHPLARAVRADKLCLAGLSNTLLSFLTNRAQDEVPVWMMISRSLESIDLEASEIVDAFGSAGLEAEVVDGQSTIGGGSLPGSTLPTRLAAISKLDVDSFAAKLRTNKPSIVARISDNRLLFDPRTLLPGQSEEVIEAVIDLSRNVAEGE